MAYQSRCGNISCYPYSEVRRGAELRFRPSCSGISAPSWLAQPGWGFASPSPRSGRLTPWANLWSWLQSPASCVSAPPWRSTVY